ncbi:hypothetical protein Ddc_08750 [Ditylenchus destructor]|nr:hypothetical protein Ddc_08750 [Ditylenchus destructor]
MNVLPNEVFLQANLGTGQAKLSQSTCTGSICHPSSVTLCEHDLLFGACGVGFQPFAAGFYPFCHNEIQTFTFNLTGLKLRLVGFMATDQVFIGIGDFRAVEENHHASWIIFEDLILSTLTKMPLRLTDVIALIVTIAAPIGVLLLAKIPDNKDIWMHLIQNILGILIVYANLFTMILQRCVPSWIEFLRRRSHGNEIEINTDIMRFVLWLGLLLSTYLFTGRSSIVLDFQNTFSAAVFSAKQIYDTAHKRQVRRPTRSESILEADNNRLRQTVFVLVCLLVMAFLYVAVVTFGSLYYLKK